MAAELDDWRLVEVAENPTAIIGAWDKYVAGVFRVSFVVDCCYQKRNEHRTEQAQQYLTISRTGLC